MTHGERATKIREMCLKTLQRTKSGHLGSNSSIAEIIAVIYGGVLRKEDHFLLSKGHACLAVFSALALNGTIPEEWLDTYYENDGMLPGHITAGKIPGVEFSFGSLGHGLPVGCGMAKAMIDRKVMETEDGRVFVVLSDGEMQEGSNWEAALFASHHKLNNVVAIVDNNKLQCIDWVENVINIEPLAEKWRAFGWEVLEIDGHNVSQVENALLEKGEKPKCVIAHTVKGKDMGELENTIESHRFIPEFNQI
jgi:transketolase